MCLECVFSSFSTDSGCTVQLVSTADDNTVQYTETFTRSTSSSTTAGGCISSVISGQYSVTVYDEGSSIVAVTLAGLIVLMINEMSCTIPTTVCSTSIISSDCICPGNCELR